MDYISILWVQGPASLDDVPQPVSTTKFWEIQCIHGLLPQPHSQDQDPGYDVGIIFIHVTIIINQSSPINHHQSIIIINQSSSIIIINQSSSINHHKSIIINQSSPINTIDHDHHRHSHFHHNHYHQHH